MKEKRFIELLNLYVDHQLDPAGTAELETELKGNPARYRTYLQYVHMQKACSILFETERCNAPSAGILARAMAKADRRIEQPAGLRAAWHRGLFAFGGLAVATCVAVVVLARFGGEPAQPPSPASHGAQVAAIETAETVEVPASIAAGEMEKPMYAVVTVPALARRDESPAYPVMNLRQFAAFGPKTKAGLAMPATPYLENAGLQWTRDVRLRPIRQVAPDNLFFERHDLASEEMRGLFEIRPVAQQPAEEMTVLQFQH